MMKRALRQGLIAGTAGGLVMTVGEKIEQSLTSQPDSHVPGRVLERLTGRPERRGKQPLPVNWAMHFGQAAVLGVTGTRWGGLEPGRSPGRTQSRRSAVIAMSKQYAVAASGQWWDGESNQRLPSGEAHALEQGRNDRSQLGCFPHVAWPEVAQPPAGKT
ncbi:hypothetical protein ABZY06_21620 [Streptomyces sp. NPDC006540]|jgi:hypothetical protein|uniref:hypothetical protein n=1 Tax=Streptomyces sp. NPDC006540 TaxID=3155353 RepID=UPI00339E3C0C